MSKKIKDYHPSGVNIIEVKSEFDGEFRRIGIDRLGGAVFESFYKRLECLHQLQGVPFAIFYTDKDGDPLPINNNDNFAVALSSPSLRVLRIIIRRKDENWSDLIGYSTLNRKKEAGKGKILGLTQLPITTHSASKPKTPQLKIGMPEDFRQVSAIIDVDIVPDTHRRVRLLKHGSDKPLGFFIRDGVNLQSTRHGLEKVPGVFISRVVPGGLAESTGLLSVNDEVVEVNGIEVAGKSLDQVTDMMVANCSNLIITVKPANQRYQSVSPSVSEAQLKSRTNPQRSSQMSASALSTSSYASNHSYNTDDDDLDEIRDMTGNDDLLRNASGSSGTSSSSTAPPRDSGHYGNGKRSVSKGQHVTKIILDGKHDGIIHEAEQVFTL